MANLQIYRENGRLQFDASMMTFALHTKGTVASGPRFAANTSPSTAKVPIPAGLERYLIATRAGFYVARGGISQDANGQRYEIFQCDAGVGSSFEYYFFARASEFPVKGWGLEMFSEDGKCTFSSHLDTMVISGFISGLGSSVTMPGGRKYAAIQPMMAGEEYETEGVVGGGSGPIIIGDDPGNEGRPQQWYRQMHGKLHGIRWSDTTASIGEVSFDDVLGQTNYGSSPDPAREFWRIQIENAMLVDVTGL